jgi:lysozyme
MPTAVCTEALALIEEFESCLRKVGPDLYAPYLDPVKIPTVGIGSIWRKDGSRVEITDPPITKAQCYELMNHELNMKCIPAVNRLITVPLHPLSYGALVSFTYNCGDGALKGSTLRKMINARRWSEVPAEFAKWRTAKGVVFAGLVRRRTAESKMFMKGVSLQRTSVAENDDGGWTATVSRAA